MTKAAKGTAKLPKHITLIPGSKNYGYRFEVGGQLYKESTGTSSIREAMRIKNTAMEEAKRRHAEEKVRQSGGKADMTFAEAVARYLELKGDDLDLRPVIFDKLVEWIGPNTRMSDLDAEMIHEAIEHRRKEVKTNQKGKPVMHKDPKTGKMVPKKLADATINRTTWQVIKRIYMGARDRWRVPVQPIDWKQFSKLLRKEKIRTAELDIVDEARWEGHLREGYGAVFKFSLLSGLRLQNCIDLRWEHVNWGAMEIRLIQKGDEPLVKLIDDEMAELLKAEIGKHPERVFTFVSERTWTVANTGEKRVKGERYVVTKHGYVTWFTRVAKRLGMQNLTRHDLRRTSGSRMLRFTGNLKAASLHLGHSDITTTAKRYAHVTPDDLRDVVRKTQAAVAARRQKLTDDGVIRYPQPHDAAPTGEQKANRFPTGLAQKSVK